MKKRRIFRRVIQILCLVLFFLFQPDFAHSRITIDINSPSIQRLKVAVLDFKYISGGGEKNRFRTTLPAILSNDLELSGYFQCIEKDAFLVEDTTSIDPYRIRFRDWTAIGADLLIYGAYTIIGRLMEVEVRLYDVFSARQIFAKRFVGKVKRHRKIIHRISNEIIKAITGTEGIFLLKIAYVDNSTGYKEIYVSDIDGHNIEQITNDRGISLFPRLSPDGKRLLYCSYKKGGPMLYMKDIISGSEKDISSRKGLNIGASWSPDGKRIALTMSEKDNPDIFIIDLNGNIIERVTNYWGIDVSPVFSPDGTRIAFVSNRSGSPQIYIKELESGLIRRLTFNGRYNTSPSWSKSGRIAYAGMKNGKFDIYTIDPDGSNLRMLTSGPGNNEDPCWSPEGRYLFFSSNRTGKYRIYIMTSNGKNQRKITSGKGEQSSPSVSK